jgi:hypothetical protein
MTLWKSHDPLVVFTIAIRRFYFYSEVLRARAE